MNEELVNEELEKRLMELEIRSEERREDIVRLERFVEAYEQRIKTLEGELKLMRETMSEGVEGLPPADQDLPPHY